MCDLEQVQSIFALLTSVITVCKFVFYDYDYKGQKKINRLSIWKIQKMGCSYTEGELGLQTRSQQP